MKSTTPSVRGIITDVRANDLFAIDVNGKEYIGFRSGKMRKHHISVLLGDTVDVVLDPYGGKTSNRIIRRVLNQ